MAVRNFPRGLMQPIFAAEPSYDTRTIWFHWLTAGLIALQWIGAKTIDMWPRGALQVDATSVHITGGVLLGLIAIARLVWRFSGGRRLVQADHGLLQVLARVVHWGLYLLILTVVGLGIAMLSQRSTSYFNLFMLPALASGTRAGFRSYHGIHGLLANTILIVAFGHAAAAIAHQYIFKDGVLTRMIPGLR